MKILSGLVRHRNNTICPRKRPTRPPRSPSLSEYFFRMLRKSLESKIVHRDYTSISPVSRQSIIRSMKYLDSISSHLAPHTPLWNLHRREVMLIDRWINRKLRRGVMVKHIGVFMINARKRSRKMISIPADSTTFTKHRGCIDPNSHTLSVQTPVLSGA